MQNTWVFFVCWVCQAEYYYQYTDEDYYASQADELGYDVSWVGSSIYGNYDADIFEPSEDEDYYGEIYYVDENLQVEKMTTEMPKMEVTKASIQDLWQQFLDLARANDMVEETNTWKPDEVIESATKSPTTTSPTTTSTSTRVFTTTTSPTPTPKPTMSTLNFIWTTPNIPTTTPTPTVDPKIHQQNLIRNQKIIAELISQDGKIDPIKYKCKMMEETLKYQDNMIPDLALALVKNCYQENGLRIPSDLNYMYQFTTISPLHTDHYLANEGYWDVTLGPDYAKEVLAYSTTVAPSTTVIYPDIVESLAFHNRIETARRYFRDLAVYTRSFVQMQFRQSQMSNVMNTNVQMAVLINPLKNYLAPQITTLLAIGYG